MFVSLYSCCIAWCSSVFLCCERSFLVLLLFFFNATATTEIYTLSLHDALPIFWLIANCQLLSASSWYNLQQWGLDRKSTRLNSSHQIISYAVFCLKKKSNSSLALDRVACAPMSSLSKLRS